MHILYRIFWYRWYLRRHKTDNQIVKQETQFWKANAIQWITKFLTGKQAKKAVKNVERLREECNNLDAFLTSRDRNGVESKVSLPILTPEEAIRMGRGKRNHLFFVILLGLVDTFLFSLIAVYFMPPESGYGTKLMFGGICAFSIISTWEGGFVGILTFLKDRQLYKKGILENLGISYMKLIVGIILLSVAIFLSIAVGVVRMHVLEGVDTTQLGIFSKETSNNIRAAGSWASVASMVFAFLTGFLLGFSRIMTDTFGERGKMYRNYKRKYALICDLRNRVEKFHINAQKDIKDYIERNWKAVLYVRNVLRRDYDEEDRDQATALKAARKDPGFKYTEETYNIYQDVQSMDERLFKSGLAAAEACLEGYQKLHEVMEEFRSICAEFDRSHKINNQPPRKISPANWGKAAAFSLTLAICVGLSGCKEHRPKPASVVIFLDHSTSLPQETLDFYIKFIYRALTYLKPGDQIRVLPIDRNTESGSSELVNLTVPSQDQFANPYDPPAQANELIKARFGKFQDSIVNALRAGIMQLQQRPGALKEGTDIFGGIRVAQQYFDPSKVNVLIFCSDMLNFSSELKMEHVRLDNRFTNKALQLLPHDYRNTDYYGIYCVTGPNNGLDQDTFKGARHFWLTYFDQARFHNTFYVSGETSLVETKLAQIKNLDTTVERKFF